MDLRVRELQIEIWPPLPKIEVSIMLLCAVFIGVCLGVAF